jgi:hypothetical protein
MALQAGCRLTFCTSFMRMKKEAADSTAPGCFPYWQIRRLVYECLFAPGPWSRGDVPQIVDVPLPVRRMLLKLMMVVKTMMMISTMLIMTSISEAITAAPPPVRVIAGGARDDTSQTAAFLLIRNLNEESY